MLGILGLLGALFAGVVADTMVSTSHHGAAEDDPAPDELDPNDTPDQSSDGGSLLDDPNAANDPGVGLPTSDDSTDPVDDPVNLDGSDGNDVLTGNGGDDDVSGGEGNDLLGGRDGNDSIDGGGGEDWEHGGTGDDTMSGADGQDDLHGEDGNDMLDGGASNDTLSGDFGNDRLNGSANDDSLIGGDGEDTLTGGRDNDEVQGGTGSDLMAGGRGEDTVDGGDGADTIWGEGPSSGDDHTMDFLNGGTGDDLIRVGSGDYASGGDGADQFVLDDIHQGDPVAQITDYNPHEDSLVVLYDPSQHPNPELSLDVPSGSSDATVMLDGVAVANVQGGAGLSISDFILKAA